MSKKAHEDGKGGSKSGSTAAPKAAPESAAGDDGGYGAFVTNDQFTAYQHFAPLVESIAPADRITLRGADPKIMRANVDRAAANVRARAPAILAKQPGFDVRQALETPALVQAFDYADGLVVKPASSGEIAAKLAQVRPLRENALKQLDVLAFLGHVSAARVQAIHENTGPFDIADDAVKIYGMFQESSAALKGLHPFPQAMLDELGALGNWLLAQLTPTGAQAAATEKSPQQVVRDQLGTKLTNDYELLREGAVTVAGLRKLDEFAPPLLSRVHAAKVEADANPPPGAPKTEDAPAEDKTPKK